MCYSGVKRREFCYGTFGLAVMYLGFGTREHDGNIITEVQ